MSRSSTGLALKAVGALILLGVALYIVTILIQLLKIAAALLVLGLFAFLAYKLASFFFGSDDSKQSWNSSTLDSEYDTGVESESNRLGGLLSDSDEPVESDSETPDSELDRIQEQYVNGELTDVEFERRMEEVMADEEGESELATESE
jgi:hypothetical protein